MLITEVHYTDLYPASFQEFRKKYLPLVRKKQAFDLYVQFTNHANNTMDRTAFQKPDHSDMVGVYSYPLAYVLTHPADVWYGQGARYLRVLRDHSKNTLNLRYIDNENKAIRLLQDMGFSWHDAQTTIDTAKLVYKKIFKGTTKWGKIALSAIQMDLLGEPLEPEKRSLFGYEPATYRTRSGIEQTQLLRKAGYDAVVETGTSNKSAILNEREPEQKVFLTRAAFRVVEVFALRPGLPDKDLPVFTTTDPSNTRIERPLAAMIARAMDDRLSEARKPFGNLRYWTKKGRRIEIEFDRPRSYYDNRKMGEKRHREFRLSDSHMTKVHIYSERGEFSRTYMPEETFKDIAGDVVRWWRGAEQQTAAWEPESQKSYEASLKAAENRALQQRLDAETQKRIAELPQFFDDVRWAAARYGLPFHSIGDPDREQFLLEALNYLSSFWSRHAEDPSAIKEGLEWVRDEVLSAPRSAVLIPEWNEMSAILLTAWEREIKQHDKNWLFIRGGDSVFKHLRHYILDGKD